MMVADIKPSVIRLWDPLVRLFHWSLAGIFVANYWINETGEDWHKWLGYIAIAFFKHFVEGPMRDPASLNKPSTLPLDETLRIGTMGSWDVHWGLVFGIVLCLVSAVWLSQSTHGFATRVVGGNARAARLVGLPSARIIITASDGALGRLSSPSMPGSAIAIARTVESPRLSRLTAA